MTALLYRQNRLDPPYSLLYRDKPADLPKASDADKRLLLNGNPIPSSFESLDRDQDEQSSSATNPYELTINNAQAQETQVSISDSKLFSKAFSFGPENIKQLQRYLNKILVQANQTDSSSKKKGNLQKYAVAICRQPRNFKQKYCDPKMNAGEERQNLEDLHSQLQNQRDDQQKFRIIYVVDRQIRRLTKNWEFNNKTNQPYIKKLLDTIKVKIGSVANKKLIKDYIYQLISYLENLLGQSGSHKSSLFENRIDRQPRMFQQCEYDADKDAKNQKTKMLEDLISEFQRNDYSYLFKRQEMLDRQIRKVTTNWEFNKIIYEPHIKRLMDLIKAKIEFVSESRIIYERIYLLVEYLEKLLDYRGSRRQAEYEQNVADFLYQHVLQELQQRPGRNGVYYIRNSVNSDTKISLNEHISKHPIFSEESWREILFLTANHINERYHKELPKPLKLGQKKQQNFYDCIGCVRFFNINENVYYPEKLKGLLALGGSCMRIEANRATVLEEICGLLNGGGGTLLFNTQLYYNNVFARGQYVTEIQKEEIEQRLNTLLNFIYPKPKQANILLTWVPMVDPTQPSDERNPLSFVDGLYVARVMIKPTEGHIAYFWIQEGAPIFSIREKSIEPKGKRIIKGKDIRKFIKQKFERFEAECLEQDESQDKELIKSSMPILHKCCQPHLGKQISQPRAQIEKEEDNEHEKFTYASIVVAKKSDHETIRNNLKKYNIGCVIRTPFERLKLRGASNSTILYHNTRFDELLGVVSYNNDFKFNDKFLLLILITPYIKLIERNRDNQMNENDLKSLGVWLNREYPRETLSLWQFINEDDQLEYYISTGTRESSLYIYIVMTQFQEKSSFKNPKGLERFSKEERERRFKNIYKT